MPFKIIDEDERLPFHLPDQTGDGEGGVFWYRRMPSGDVRQKRAALSLVGDDRDAWDQEARRQYEEALIRYAHLGSSGVVVQKGDKLEEVQATPDQVLKLPVEVHHAYVRFIEGDVIYVPTKKPGEPAKAPDDPAEVVLPNC